MPELTFIDIVRCLLLALLRLLEVRSLDVRRIMLSGKGSGKRVPEAVAAMTAVAGAVARTEKACGRMLSTKITFGAQPAMLG